MDTEAATGSIRKLTAKIRSRQKMVGAAVGSGMAAAAAEQGGADLLMALSAGHFRSQGCSSMAALLPFANSNRLTEELAYRHVLPRIRHTPVFLGLCAQDPGLELSAVFKRALDHGIAGITNFPSVGFIDGQYREAIEEQALGMAREIEMLAAARRSGLLTVGFCFDAEHALLMAREEVDILNLDLGFAEWREVDTAEHQAALDRVVALAGEVDQSLRKAGSVAYLAIFGGPVVLPQDAEQLFQRAPVLGYIGGSTIERFPAAPTIAQTVRQFRHAAEREPGGRLGAIVSVSPRMAELFDRMRSVAESSAPVLILGQSGTGKELIAREIHRLSRRCQQPLVCWNCGATTESLAMSELFGHEKGAFTGADRTRLGRFETANGATLFMDEVADLPLSVQASLLRVIQEKEIVRVGGQEPIPVDVRLIAASNRDFRELIPSGKFRQDLYYRLSTVVLAIPPLRERPEDIPLLINEFLNEFSQLYRCPVPSIPDPVMDALLRHPWPGNIRELRGVIERGIILGRGARFQRAWVEDSLAGAKSGGAPGPGASGPAGKRLAPRERRELATRTVEHHQGNKAAAARELGVTRKTLYDWLRRARRR